MAPPWSKAEHAQLAELAAYNAPVAELAHRYAPAFPGRSEQALKLRLWRLRGGQRAQEERPYRRVILPDHVELEFPGGATISGTPTDVAAVFRALDADR